MAQTLVNIGSPYEVNWTQPANPLTANTFVFGPVTRSTKLLLAQAFYTSASSTSASIALVHDPATGPVGTGSIIGSNVLLSTVASAGTANAWTLVGSTQLVAGDWLAIAVTGSTGTMGKLQISIQAMPN